MIRRMFLKWFGGASAAAAVTIGPKVAEAVQRAKEEPVGSWPIVFNQKRYPRTIQGFGISDDLLYKLGFPINPKKSDLLRIDEVVKSVGLVPYDASLEFVSPVINQAVLVFLYHHPSFVRSRACDVICMEAADERKFKRFFRHE